MTMLGLWMVVTVYWVFITQPALLTKQLEGVRARRQRGAGLIDKLRWRRWGWLRHGHDGRAPLPAAWDEGQFLGARRELPFLWLAGVMGP